MTAAIKPAFATPVRGLRKREAARFVGISTTKFDALVEDGRMPKPFKIDGVVLWDVNELDQAFTLLRDGAGPEPETGNSWDDLLGEQADLHS